MGVGITQSTSRRIEMVLMVVLSLYVGALSGKRFLNPDQKSI